jgi:diaminopimelate decarboxylase
VTDVTGALRLDECLSVRGGHLFVEACDAVELARTFGTPVFVVSENQLRRNARRIKEAFGSRWPEGPVNVLPSIKANFSLALRRILTQEGLGCDTFGPGELEAALRCGVRPGMISVNGSAKDAALIERAVASGARITLDSAREIEMVREIAGRLGARAVVRFRLRPDYRDLGQPSEFVEEDVPIRLFAQTYKPGIPTDDLLRAGREALAARELDVSGVMAHLGRHHHETGMWRGMVTGLVDTIATLSRAWGGWTPREVDVGGGFASPRDPTGRALRRGAGRPERGPSVEEYAEAVTSSLRSEFSRHALDANGVTLEIEPGRAMYADAGVHLSTVVNVKHEPGREPPGWVETDTSEAFLPDVLIEHARFVTLAANKADRPHRELVDVVGKSCGFDVLGTQVPLPELEAGDVLAFLDTGAYQEAAAFNFNAMPRPAVVLVCDDAAEVVKRAETVDDVFGRDLVPERLVGGP